jgi:hypothetical protein
VEIVDFSEKEDEKISYCKECLKFGFSVPLKNRIYPDGESIPVDNENFLQCYECGTIVPVYELEKESQIKDVVEISDNPFDVAKDSFVGIDRRTSSTGKRKKRLKDRDNALNDIKETDLTADLAKGNTLISYSEYMPQ